MTNGCKLAMMRYQGIKMLIKIDPGERGGVFSLWLGGNVN